MIVWDANKQRMERPAKLVWTPGHVGIPINDVADIFSRRSTLDGSARRSLDYRDAMASALLTQHQAILQHWQSIASNRALRHLWQFQRWPSNGCSSCDSEVLLYRLRTNTAPLNVFLYSRKLHPTAATLWRTWNFDSLLDWVPDIHKGEDYSRCSIRHFHHLPTKLKCDLLASAISECPLTHSSSRALHNNDSMLHLKSRQ